MMTHAFRSLVLASLTVIAVLVPARAAEITLDETRREIVAALPTIQGNSITAEGLAGRIVVLTFFASWCPPCHVEFDHLNSLRQAYGDDQVAIVAINIFEDYLPTPGGLKGFLAKKAPLFSVVGQGEDIAAAFGDVDRIPTLFVFGADGAPLLHFVHARGAKKTHADLAEITAAVEAGL